MAEQPSNAVPEQVGDDSASRSGTLDDASGGRDEGFAPELRLNESEPVPLPPVRLEVQSSDLDTHRLFLARRVLSLLVAVVLITVTSGGVALVRGSIGWDSYRELLALILGPLFTLFSGIAGFYFGQRAGESTREGRA